jgi:hypothetical protein
VPCSAPEADEHARQAVAAARRLHRLRHRQLEAVLHLRAGWQGLSTSCEHAVRSSHAQLAVQANSVECCTEPVHLAAPHERCCPCLWLVRSKPYEQLSHSEVCASAELCNATSMHDQKRALHNHDRSMRCSPYATTGAAASESFP